MKRGDIVRYGPGSTALAKLLFPHAGGWQAAHCMGGSTYLSSGYPLRLANEKDLWMWKKQAWHRGEGIPPIWRPKIKKVGGCWTVNWYAGCPESWKLKYLEMVGEAQAFIRRLNYEASVKE